MITEEAIKKLLKKTQEMQCMPMTAALLAIEWKLQRELLGELKFGLQNIADMNRRPDSVYQDAILGASRLLSKVREYEER